jgi:hypothetical protein
MDPSSSQYMNRRDQGQARNGILYMPPNRPPALLSSTGRTCVSAICAPAALALIDDSDRI